MAYSKKLSEAENKARARRDSHAYRHKVNNLPARVHNKAARLAAQWVQEQHPVKWAALVRQARDQEQANSSTYTPHSVRFAGGCEHGRVKAVGIVRQCLDCGEILGTWAVQETTNQELLQEILEAEDGA